MPPPKSEGTGVAHSWAEIDLDAIRHNTRVLAACLPPGTSIIAMVKSNAYGLGATQAAEAALSAGARALGVAYPSEGAELRERGIRAPILVIGGYIPEEADLLVSHGLTPALGDALAVRDLETRARRAGRRMGVHLHVDTGMTRLGTPVRKAGFLASNVARSQDLQLEGVSTHLSTADELDASFARLQIQRFRQAVEAIRAEGVSPGMLHVANTAAILRHGSQVAFDAVRPGLGLYGMLPADTCRGIADLVPVLEWRARLVRVETIPAGTFVSYARTWKAEKETRIGTVSVGYGDGYSRRVEGRASVLIEGRRYPIVGRVTMDHLMVDLGTETPLPHGAVVTLLGQDGHDRITAEEMASWTGGIPYEVPTGIAPRVRRLYRGEEAKARPRVVGLPA